MDLKIGEINMKQLKNNGMITVREIAEYLRISLLLNLIPVSAGAGFIVIFATLPV